MRSALLAATVLVAGVAVVAPADAEPSASSPVPTTYGCTGSQQATTVPTGVGTLTVTAAGAQGGSRLPVGSDGGLGGTVTATVPIGGTVKPGDTLIVDVGCTPSGATGGFGLPSGGRGGAGGGGGSAVVDTSAGTPPLVIALAAGGGAGNGGTGAGGAGGYPSGTAGDSGNSMFASGGGGGTTTTSGGTGGVGGVGYTCILGHCFASGSGSPGGFLKAGDGDTVAGGGGGGGGWYGGGGGGGCEKGSLADPICYATPGAGGGGSSYFGFPATTTTGTNVGNGSVTLTYTSSADLSVTIAAVPKPVFLVAPVVYTVTAHNGGPDAAQAVRLTVALPVDRTGSVSLFVVARPSTGTCVTPAFFGTGVVSCQMPTLGPGANVTVQIVTIQLALPGSAPTATASVSSSTPDPNPANNSASTLA